MSPLSSIELFFSSFFPTAHALLKDKAATANLWLRVPWLSEALYLATTSAAALATGHHLFWHAVALPSARRRRHAPLLLVAGGAANLMALCLPLDPLLCAAGTALGLGSAVVPLLFAASDVAFCAVAALAARGLPPPPAGAAVGRARKAA